MDERGVVVGEARRRESCGIDFNQSIFALQLHCVTMKITEAEKQAIDSSIGRWQEIKPAESRNA